MKFLRAIIYQPYLLFFIAWGANFYYYSQQTSWDKTLPMVYSFLFYLPLIALLFFKLLKNSLLRLVTKIPFINKIPASVLVGYLFIFTFFFPLVAIPLAILSKLLIWENGNRQTYIDEYGNEITHIKSLTPTVILSRKENETGEEEHIVMTKLKKKPKKIIYE